MGGQYIQSGYASREGEDVGNFFHLVSQTMRILHRDERCLGTGLPVGTAVSWLGGQQLSAADRVDTAARTVLFSLILQHTHRGLHVRLSLVQLHPNLTAPSPPHQLIPRLLEAGCPLPPRLGGGQVPAVTAVLGIAPPPPLPLYLPSANVHCCA